LRQMVGAKEYICNASLLINIDAILANFLDNCRLLHKPMDCDAGYA
jgi:hypothetical protein